MKRRKRGAGMVDGMNREKRGKKKEETHEIARHEKREARKSV